MSRARTAVALGVFVASTICLVAQEQPRWQALVELARQQAQAGDRAAAEQTYKTALAETQDSDPQLGLVVVTGYLAQLYGKQNRLDEAEALYRDVLASQERKFGVLHPQVAYWSFELGRILGQRAAYDEAEQLALRAVTIHEGQPAQNVNLRQVLQFLMRLYQAQGRNEEASAVVEQLVERAQARLRDAEVRFGEDHSIVAGSLVELAEAHSEAGQNDQAEAGMQRALKIYESSLEAYPELTMPYSGALRRMARIYSNLGREDTSRELLARAGTLSDGALHYERPAGR